MKCYQDPFVLDQVDGDAYFTGFPEDDEQNSQAMKYFDPWTMASPTLQNPSDLYTIPSYASDESYISPYLDSLESPFAETFAPLEVQCHNSQFSSELQPRSSLDEQWPTFESKTNIDVLPIASPTSASPVSPITPTYPPRNRTTRFPPSYSPNQQQTKPKPKVTRPRKKRNATTPPSSSEDESAARKAKHAHSIIERRYRDNLNGRMMQLHRVLAAVESTTAGEPWPTSQSLNSPDSGQGAGDRRRTSSASASTSTSTRVRKSDIMTSAIEYIQRSEVQRRHMIDEIRRLQEQIRVYQKLLEGEGLQMLR